MCQGVDMTEIVKRLKPKDWERFRELLGVENVGYVRFTTYTNVFDEAGRMRGGTSDGTLEVAMKESPVPPEGTRRMKVSLKDAASVGGNFYFSWALVSMTKSADGEWKEHEDLDGDTMDDEVLVDAAKGVFGTPSPFYEGHDMDDRTIKGWVQWFPLTRDVQKGLSMDGSVSGLAAMIRVDDADLRQRIDSGEMPDVSIEAMVAQ